MQQTPRPLAQEPEAVPPLLVQSPLVRQVPVVDRESLPVQSTGWTCAKTRNTVGTKMKSEGLHMGDMEYRTYREHRNEKDDSFTNYAKIGSERGG